MMNSNARNRKVPEMRIPPLASLNLVDDFLFEAVTVDLTTCKDIVELILEEEIVDIRWKEGQKTVQNLPGRRGIRMDFYVEDIRGRIINVEMQKRNVGNIPKRTRFYQALIDAPLLDRGEQGFDRLNPTLIIVICPFDLYGQGLYRYTFANCCIENPNILLGDESKKIILNTRGWKEEGVGQGLIDFLHYVEHSNDSEAELTKDSRIKRLHQKICHIKESEQMEVEYMKAEERDRLIREEGRERAIRSVVRNMLERGMSDDDIKALAECEQIVIDEIREEFREESEQK